MTAVIGACGLVSPALGDAGEALLAATVQVAQAVQQAVPASIIIPDTPTASPVVKPTATPAPAVRHGGPLELSLNGSLSLGANSSSSATTDQFGNVSASQISQTNEAAGMVAEIKRRTATTTTDFQLPLNFANHGSQSGVAQLLFSTPRYSLGYGVQTLGVLGQLAAGGTERGYSFVLPTRGGDLTFFQGPALGTNYTTIKLMGVRERRLLDGKLFELGLYRSSGNGDVGAATTLLSGLAANAGKASILSEIAFQKVQATNTDPGSHGFAFQSRVDLGAPASTWTLTMRGLPSRYLSYGAGEVYGDQLADLGYVGMSGSRTYNFDFALERSTLDAQVTAQRRTAFSIGGQIGKAAYNINLGDQYLGGSASPQWTGTAGAQLAFFFPKSSITLGSQLQRLTIGDASPSASLLRSIQVQHQFGSFAVQLADQDQRTTGGLDGTTHYANQYAQLSRNFGRTTLGYSYQLSHTQTLASDATQRTPLINVTRQISPVISVTASYGTQTLHDALNHSADGKSRVFNLQFNAPFSFGNSLVQGRTDPRLPATIVGRVSTDPGQNLAFAALASSGVGNVLVELDGRDVQRTDLNGNFQFSFVSPGQHQVRIESASLPRGLVADQPIVTLDLQGGQSGQVNFVIGNFGGVQGHVYGTDSSGARTGLQNVLLRVDGGSYSQTDQDGAYGFGKLQPGDHTIDIIPNSVPAFANFDQKDLSRKVTVQNGQIIPLDFIAEPLGSIAGKIIYASDAPPPYVAGGGVLNAYVVAEPGEHAAIASDDGSFIIDNLPPGAYTLSVDPETVPDQLGQTNPDLSVTLGPQEHYEGAIFTIGHKLKKIIFSFFSGNGKAMSSQPTIDLAESRLPPDGATPVWVDAPEDAGAVSVAVLGKSEQLEYDARRKAWSGEIDVPSDAKPGTYTVDATVRKGARPLSASLTVDPRMPLAIVQVNPASPAMGEWVTVRVRFLADARQGDKIRWEDGQETALSKPVSGRVFTFGVRISLRPMHGTLLTRHASVPIRIL